LFDAPAWRHKAWVSSDIDERPTDKRIVDSGITIRGAKIVRTKLKGFELGQPVERCARHLDQKVDRNTLGRRVQDRQLLQ
jgi:hypothetical protein